MTKTCSRCLTGKAFSEFGKDSHRKDGLRGICKPCERDDVSRRSESVKSSRLKYRYGITTKDWDEMFQSQGEVCKICGTDDPGHPKGWGTDHNHQTLEVRGIVCQPCNIRTGAIEAAMLSDVGLKAYLDHIGSF